MNHPNLAPFVVDEWLCGRLLGIGSYGSVEEVSQLSLLRTFNHGRKAGDEARGKIIGDDHNNFSS